MMADAEALVDGTQDAAKEKGTPRVVLRGVRALKLDDLPADAHRKVLEVVGEVANVSDVVSEGWFAMAARTGTPEGAVASYAGTSGDPGCKPGTYKAPPTSSWFVRSQRVEPPLS